VAKIAPLITSIYSIDVGGQDLFEMAYNNNNNNINDDDVNRHESQLLLKEMMEKAKIVMTNWLVYNTYFAVYLILFIIF
jgi:hypothetical protein